jgi:Domain of Unknown Function (DUF1543)
MNKLFAVYLGGRAEKCNTELHDVVFAIGETIEETYEQLLEKWFGTPVGLHLDSWMELSVVDGHKIKLADDADDTAAGAKLFFVNLGAYAADQFTELHANVFVVAETALEAKTRAKTLLHNNLPGPVHTDDLYDVDDCVELYMVGAHRIMLEKTGRKQVIHPVNGFHPIPAAIVHDFMVRHEVAVAK